MLARNGIEGTFPFLVGKATGANVEVHDISFRIGFSRTRLN